MTLLLICFKKNHASTVAATRIFHLLYCTYSSTVPVHHKYRPVLTYQNNDGQRSARVRRSHPSGRQHILRYKRQHHCHFQLTAFPNRTYYEACIAQSPSLSNFFFTVERRGWPLSCVCPFVALLTHDPSLASLSLFLPSSMLSESWIILRRSSVRRTKYSRVTFCWCSNKTVSWRK